MSIVRKMIATSAVALIATAMLHAGTQPKFTLVPTTPTAFLMPVNYIKTVQYQVSNQTRVLRTLTMKPIAGVTQLTTGKGVCAKPFTLAPKQQCTLKLQINGSQVSGQIKGGPEICKTQNSGNPTPDPFLCSQPALNNSLRISSIPGGQYAYIVNQAGNSLSFCQINPVTGFLEHCAVTATGLSAPEAIAINPAGTLLYAANPGNNSITVCQVNASSGALSGCVDAGGSGFDLPSGVAVNPAGNILYASNGGGAAGVSACTIDTRTGLLTTCTNNMSPTFRQPFDMALNAAGTLAYVVNFKSSTVSICRVNGTTVSLCDDRSGSSFNGPEGVTLSPSGKLAYIANNGSNQLTLCKVNAATGLLFGCAVTEGSFDGTGNVGLNQAGTFAYVPNFVGNRVFVCAANPLTGALSNCKHALGTGFNRPAGILLH